MKLSGFGWAALALVAGFCVIGMSRCQLPNLSPLERWCDGDPRQGTPMYDPDNFQIVDSVRIGVGGGGAVATVTPTVVPTPTPWVRRSR